MNTIRNLKTAAREWLRLNWIKAILILLLGFVAGAVIAAPAVNLTLTVAPGNVPTLTWTSSDVTSCTASGAWTGTKATSGSQTLSAVTASGLYTLTCTSPGDTVAALTCVAPTQNTDGSALTDLAGFRFYQGAAAGSLGNMVQVPGSTCAYTFTGLAAGTNYFAASAYNQQGVESALSAVGSKTNNAGASVNDSEKLNVPKAPTLTVQSPVAYDVQQKGLKFVLGREVGRVPNGTACSKDFELKGGFYRVEREAVEFARKARSAVVVAKCAQT